MMQEEENDGKLREKSYLAKLEVEQKHKAELEARQARQVAQLAEEVMLSQEFVAFMLEGWQPLRGRRDGWEWEFDKEKGFSVKKLRDSFEEYRGGELSSQYGGDVIELDCT